MSVPVVFSTGSLYPFGLNRVYSLAAEAGYDGMEIMMDDRWDTHQADYLLHLSGQYGLPVRALHEPLGQGVWGLNRWETLIRVAGLAGKVGAGAVVAHPPPVGVSMDHWKEQALDEARATGTAVAVENMPRKQVRYFLLKADQLRCWSPEQLVGLGDVTLDTSHLAVSGVGPMHAFSILEDQLRHVHLSDSNLTGRDEHRVPGRGRLPLKQLLSSLAQSDYPGVVSLELKPWPVGAPDVDKILDRMREALEFTREGVES